MAARLFAEPLTMPIEPIDAYADQFQLVIGPYGATINFSVTDPVPSAPGTVPQPNRMASIRMSAEHLKAMAFLLVKQMKRFERETGISPGVPLQVLNQMGISPEDWNVFWRLD